MTYRGVFFLIAISALTLGGCSSGLGMSGTGSRGQLEALGRGSESTSLATPTGAIFGTLELPSAHAPVPVVLIIAGSGPTDRDGNTPVFASPNNSLRLFAEGLASRGIATLRYDKRGVGASKLAATTEKNLRVATYIEDAAAWIKSLRGDRRFSTVTVAGHSEGSLIGMVAAREARANAYISLEGPGRKAQDIIRSQLQAQLPPALLAESQRILERLEGGLTADSIPEPLSSLFRPTVQPYLISWFRYNPVEEIAKLTVPVMIVHGTTDLQVPVTDAMLLAGAQPHASLRIVEGMNHILKEVVASPTEQRKSYADPSLPIAPQLLDDVTGFVGRVTRRVR